MCRIPLLSSFFMSIKKIYVCFKDKIVFQLHYTIEEENCLTTNINKPDMIDIKLVLMLKSLNDIYTFKQYVQNALHKTA